MGNEILRSQNISDFTLIDNLVPAIFPPRLYSWHDLDDLMAVFGCKMKYRSVRKVEFDWSVNIQFWSEKNRHKTHFDVTKMVSADQYRLVVRLVRA